MTLRTLQDWVVRPALMRVPGVADVVSYGGLVKEIHVEPDPTKMAALGVVLDDLFEALSKASANASGGYVERGAEMFVIRSIGTFKSLDDIGKVRVGFHGGVPVQAQRRRDGHRSATRRARASSRAATTRTPSRASCSCGAAEPVGRARRRCASKIDRAHTRACCPTA